MTALGSRGGVSGVTHATAGSWRFVPHDGGVITAWSLVRFTHVIFAALWVGGQLTFSLVLIPIIRRTLPESLAAGIRSTFGKLFGIFTLAVFLPVQAVTGYAIAVHHGVTWSSLLEPGYGRTLTAKLAVFVLVLLISGIHGYLHGSGRVRAARALAVASLVGSVVIVLIATALVSF